MLPTWATWVETDIDRNVRNLEAHASDLLTHACWTCHQLVRFGGCKGETLTGVCPDPLFRLKLDLNTSLISLDPTYGWLKRGPLLILIINYVYIYICTLMCVYRFWTVNPPFWHFSSKNVRKKFVYKCNDIKCPDNVHSFILLYIQLF
jgi:hypothetical protein